MHGPVNVKFIELIFDLLFRICKRVTDTVPLKEKSDQEQGCL